MQVVVPVYGMRILSASSVATPDSVIAHGGWPALVPVAAADQVMLLPLNVP